MGHKHEIQVVRGEKVQAWLPVYVLTHLVDLVDGKTLRADGNGCGAGHHDGRAQAMASSDHLPGQAAPQLAHGIGWATWPEKDDIGMEERLQDGGFVRTERGAPLARGNDRDLRLKVLQVLSYIVRHSAGDAIGVELKAGGRFQDGHLHGRGKARHDRMVDGLGAGRSLSRAKKRHHPRTLGEHQETSYGAANESSSRTMDPFRSPTCRGCV